MNEIKDSIIASENSTIQNGKIKKTLNFNLEKKRSFWKGFLSGVAASLVANVIWYFL